MASILPRSNRRKVCTLPGFTEDDGNPDIGDSAITETVGVGAMAMVAAPGVTRFRSAGLKMPWKHGMKWQKFVWDTIRHFRSQHGTSKEHVWELTFEK